VKFFIEPEYHQTTCV